MKARTFEEWASINRPQQQPEANEAWDAAQDAMFEHADGELPLAVRVPPVEEWGEARVIRAFYYGIDHDHSMGFAFEIPRPAPKWVPKLDEPVFANGVDGEVYVGVVQELPDPGSRLYVIRYGSGTSTFTEVKPFDASLIGKPWEEI